MDMFKLLSRLGIVVALSIFSLVHGCAVLVVTPPAQPATAMVQSTDVALN